MTARHEFCSAAWIAAFGEVFTAAIRASEARYPGLSFSMAELCEGAPPHIANGRLRVGWHCFVKNGQLVRFAEGDAPDVDYRMVGDYDALIDVARFVVGEAPERRQAYDNLIRRLVSERLIRPEGVHPRLPRPFGVVHDAVAHFTA